MEPLEVETEQRDNAVILRVAGEVDSYTAPVLQEHLAAAFSEAARHKYAVVLDMTGVSFLASTGLSALVEYHTRGEDQGIALRIVAPAGSVLRALRATMLNDLLELHATLPEALAAG
ncbi:STAS domain-containing protein [Lentzea sp. NPDC005914]|uniref:STAS domain-containing protein n=1 Tax=Lentzea sp. NPDC005914 TaxID=3154572 RepID=UPI0033F95362